LKAAFYAVNEEIPKLRVGSVVPGSSDEFPARVSTGPLKSLKIHALASPFSALFRDSEVH